jgi:hypothetical protein
MHMYRGIILSNIEVIQIYSSIEIIMLLLHPIWGKWSRMELDLNNTFHLDHDQHQYKYHQYSYIQTKSSRMELDLDMLYFWMLRAIFQAPAIRLTTNNQFYGNQHSTDSTEGDALMNTTLQR